VDDKNVLVLCHTTPSLAEGDAERFVLGRLPTNAHSQPEAPIREPVQRRDLLRHECGLTLRQDQHPGAETNAPRHGGNRAQRDERLEQRRRRRVRHWATGQGPANRDVISQVDLVKTQLFDYLREVEQVGCGGRMDERKDVCCEIHLSSFRLVKA
jgi:hypothetical protein